MRIVEAGKIMGIEVVDHIIVVGYKAFNFKGRGLI
jgi:DNA repair protein RadC